MKARLFLMITVVGAALLLTSCPNPLSNQGSLTVSLTDGISAKTLQPTLSMTVARYTVRGTGPGTARFSQSTTSDTLTITALAFGTWTVTVDAFNGDGTLIGQGTTSNVLIHTAQTTSVSVTVVPLGGDGTLELTVNWNEADVESPAVQAWLLTVSGQQELGLDISGTQARNGPDGTTLPSGYYMLVLQLRDGTTLVMGAMEAVRIVSGQTTTGLYTFDKVNKPGGGLMVSITPQMNEVIEVDLGGIAAQVTTGTTVTATATVPDAPGDLQYAWCLNGALQLGQTGSSCSFGSDLAAGYYRVDVGVYTPDGSRAGSATLSFEVVAGVPEEEIFTAAVSAGGVYTMILKSDGSLWACGDNSSGQCANGTTLGSLVPVQVMASGVQAVSAGAGHTMILKIDGSLWACGQNNHGELGDGTGASHSTPVLVMTGVRAASVGNLHSMILKTDASLWACGYNTYGQLGDGTTAEKHVPVQVMTGVQAVSANGFHTMILKTDGSLWGCGENTRGQLGDGTGSMRPTPVLVMASGVQAVSAGDAHTMILKTDGTLWACGANDQGQLGDASNHDLYRPAQVMTGVRAVSAGLYHSLVVKTDGSLWACGGNDYGQLGDGTLADRYGLVQILTSAVRAVSAGSLHSMILKTDGSLWACGYNHYGELGDGTTTNRFRPVLITF